MTRYFPGTDIVYKMSVSNNGVLSPPATIAFQYKIGHQGVWIPVTPANPSTGVYTATVNPAYGGAIFWQWKTTGPNLVDEGMDYCTHSEFNYNWPTWGNYDYGFIR